MHYKNLQMYFPMIKTKDEILTIINENVRLRRKFWRWNETQQKDFLDFCSGAKGVKILYLYPS